MESDLSSTSHEYVRPKSEIVRAGAGAGKTTQLVSRVLEFAIQFHKSHGRYPSIVVTTFTRKATEELRERLLLACCQRRDSDLLKFVSSRSRLHISTIHGILFLFLRQSSLVLNLPPEFKIISDSEELKLCRRILRDLIKRGSNDHNLIEKLGWRYLERLLLCFSRAKLELNQIEPVSMDHLQNLLRAKMTHVSQKGLALANQIRELHESVKWEEMRLNIERLCRALNVSESFSDWEAQLGAFLNLRKPPTSREASSEELFLDEEFKSWRASVQELISNEYSPARWKEVQETLKVFEKTANDFFSKWHQTKCDLGQLTLSDLELFSLNAMRETPMLAEAFSQLWDFWLIDEYQDTSPVQVRLLNELCGAKPKFIVGDPQQSIYLFRGARREVFLNELEQAHRTSAQVRTLDKNFRSHPDLLSFINDTFSRIEDEGNYQEMRAHDSAEVRGSTAMRGSLEMRGSAEMRSSVEVRGSAGMRDSALIRLGIYQDESHELKGLVRWVKSLIEEGVAPADIAILCRTNDQLRHYGTFLSQANVPVQVHLKSGFFDRREVRDALALLKVLINPHDDEELINLLRSPYFNVPDEVLVSACQAKDYALKNASLWTTLQQGLFQIEALDRYVMRAQTLGIPAAFRQALIERGYFDFSLVYDPSGRREANLWKLVLRVEEISRDTNSSLLSLFTDERAPVDTEDVSGEIDAVSAIEPDRIQILTVHASKGLEYKHVFLPVINKRSLTSKQVDFCIDSEGRFSFPMQFDGEISKVRTPHEITFLEDLRKRENEESKRVFYVACTRAKRGLYFSWYGEVESGSWASYLPLNQTPGLHQGKGYEYLVEFSPPQATPDIAFDSTSPEQSAVPSQDVDGLPAKFKSTSDQRSLKRLSVTSLVSSFEKKQTSKRWQKSHLSTKPRREKRRAGVLTHQLFERFAEQLQRGNLKSALAHFPKSQRESLEELLAIADVPLLRMMKTGFTEWGFLLKENMPECLDQEVILEGQIDLWADLGEQGVWILDYKTGKVENLESAFLQLEIYAEAVRRHLSHTETLRSSDTPESKPHKFITLAVVFPHLSTAHSRPSDPRAFSRAFSEILCSRTNLMPKIT